MPQETESSFVLNTFSLHRKMGFTTHSQEQNVLYFGHTPMNLLLFLKSFIFFWKKKEGYLRISTPKISTVSGMKSEKQGGPETVGCFSVVMLGRA